MDVVGHWILAIIALVVQVKQKHPAKHFHQGISALKQKIPLKTTRLSFWGNTPGKHSKKWGGKSLLKQSSGEFCIQLADLVGIGK